MKIEITRVWMDPVLAEYPQVERSGLVDENAAFEATRRAFLEGVERGRQNEQARIVREMVEKRMGASLGDLPRV